MGTEYEDQERRAGKEFLAALLDEDWFKKLEIVQLQEQVDGAVWRRWPSVWLKCPQGHKLENVGLYVNSSGDHKWINSRSRGRMSESAPGIPAVAYTQNLVEGFRYTFECEVSGCRSKSTPVRDSTLLKLYAVALRPYADSVARREASPSLQSRKSIQIGGAPATMGRANGTIQ